MVSRRGCYKVVVSRRGMVHRSGFYDKDGTEEWFLGKDGKKY